MYEYTFPAPTVTTGLDRTKTHTVAGWISRNTGRGHATRRAARSTSCRPAAPRRSSRPSPTQAATGATGSLTAHGIAARDAALHHLPLAADRRSRDRPDRQLQGDDPQDPLRRDLPSVQAGDTPTTSSGTGRRSPTGPSSRSRGTTTASGTAPCATPGKDADNWKTKPTFTACTSCHDNVKFTSGEAPDPCPIATVVGGVTGFFKDCMHQGGPITVSNPNDVTSCQGCHGAGAANATDKYHHGDDGGAPRGGASPDPGDDDDPGTRPDPGDDDDTGTDDDGDVLRSGAPDPHVEVRQLPRHDRSAAPPSRRRTPRRSPA